MELIIDGYNLIGSEQGLRGVLEPQRTRLIQQLCAYRLATGFGVTVVFDGWRSGRTNETTEAKDGVMTVYSRQGEKADDVVVRIARERGSGCVVVSSDREVRNAVEKFGAAAIYAGEFNQILRDLESPGLKDDREDRLPRRPHKEGNPYRLSKSERRRREKLKKLKV